LPKSYRATVSASRAKNFRLSLFFISARLKPRIGVVSGVQLYPVCGKNLPGKINGVKENSITLNNLPRSLLPHIIKLKPVDNKINEGPEGVSQ